MKTRSVEDLLQDQLAACLAATQDCLDRSRQTSADDPYGHIRRHDVAYVAKLMKASARLTEALAKLRGESRQTIHVTRGVAGMGVAGADKGQG